MGGGNADFANQLSAELRTASIDLTWTQSGAQTRERLIDALFDYDLILFDSGLVGFDVRSFLDRAVDLGSELEVRTATLLSSVSSAVAESHQHQKELVLSKDSISGLGKEIGIGGQQAGYRRSGHGNKSLMDSSFQDRMYPAVEPSAWET